MQPTVTVERVTWILAPILCSVGYVYYTDRFESKYLNILEHIAIYTLFYILTYCYNFDTCKNRINFQLFCAYLKYSYGQRVGRCI